MIEPNSSTPGDYTHIEQDGTYWKNTDEHWYWWRTGWGWIPYVGQKNQNFFNKFR